MSENKALARYLLEQVQKGGFDKGHALALIKVLGAKRSRTEVAIVGISCRFSAADTAEAFWQKLIREQTGSGAYSPDRHADMRYLFGEQAVPKDASICMNNLLADIDKFDASEFSLLAKEAQLMDPGQRELLLTVWQAIDDAGYRPKQWMNTNTGVFVGIDNNGKFNIDRHVQDQSLYSSMGSMTGWFPGRIAAALNAEGPCLAIDSGCSSGLVALDAAVNAIRDNTCEQAIVASVNLLNLYQSDVADGMEGMNATTDRSAAFDDNTDGMLWGEGVCSVIVKPLKKAVEDGDHIYGVVRGTAVNHDGQAVRQGKVLQKAWQDGNINPEDLDYIEAHGTGTHLGDSIELSSIISAFKPYTKKKQFCGMGSLMANIGHTAGVSGLARVVKVLLAMKYRKLPSSPNFHVPNHHLQLEQSPVYIQDSLTEWPKPEKKKLVGVSAFSMTKTNCHMVIEEYLSSESDIPGVPYLMTVSADDRVQLKAQLNAMQKSIRRDELIDLGNMCYTANTGRQLRRHVVTVAFTSRTECLRRLELACRELGDDGFYQLQDGVVYQVLTTLPAAKQTLTILPEKSGSELHLLEQVEATYRTGKQIDWTSLYEGHTFQRISLPCYPRNTQRCWPSQSALIGVKQRTVVESSAQDEVFSEVFLSGDDRENYSETEHVIGRVWGDLLGLDVLAVDRSFFDYGGNSLSAAVLVQALTHALGKHAKVNLLYQYQTISELASAMDQKPLADIMSLEPEQSMISGEQPISATQAFMLETCESLRNPNHLTLGVVLAVDYDLSSDVVRQAAQYLDGIYDILRARFSKSAGRWQQYIEPTGLPVNFHHEDIAHLPDSERLAFIEATVNKYLYAFDLTDRPLYTVALFTQGEGYPVYLATYFHHVIMDAFSLKLYMNRLLALCGEIAAGRNPEGEAKPLSYFQYTQECQRYAHVISKQQAAFIEQVPVEDIPSLPRDIAEGINYRNAITMFTQVIDRETTDKLCRLLVKQHQVAVIDILIAAMAYTVSRWTGGEWVEIHNVIAGRDVIRDRSHDFTQTVGLFSVGCDLLLQDQQCDSPLKYLLEIQSQLASLPAGGGGNFLTQNIETRQPDSRYDYLRKEVAINYLGNMFDNGGVGHARVVEDLAIDIGDDSHLIDAAIINLWGSIQDGQLTLVWGYSRNIHHELTIRKLSEQLGDFLYHLAEGVGENR